MNLHKRILFRNLKVLLTLFKKLFSPILKLFWANNTHTEKDNRHFSVDDSDLHLGKMVAKNVGLSIPYYPKLIAHLESDHQHLLHLYTQIGNNLKNKQFHLISDQLHHFKENFVAHLESENIKFYGFLEQRLKDQSQEFASLRRFRKEMRTIERTVIKFLDYWIEHRISTAVADEFKLQYQTIGAALIKRIESEEKELYTMYQA